MIFVNEILSARLEDNQLEAKQLREDLSNLELDLIKEEDLTARTGIEALKRDVYFEYESLNKENVEIKAVLKMIQKEETSKNKQKKRAPRLATRRLNSLRYEKSHASL